MAPLRIQPDPLVLPPVERVLGRVTLHPRLCTVQIVEIGTDGARAVIDHVQYDLLDGRLALFFVEHGLLLIDHSVQFGVAEAKEVLASARAVGGVQPDARLEQTRSEAVVTVGKRSTRSD